MTPPNDAGDSGFANTINLRTVDERAPDAELMPSNSLLHCWVSSRIRGPDFLNLPDFVSGQAASLSPVVECAMPNTEAVVLSLFCPKCGHDAAQLQVASASVLTVKCTECEHPWSVENHTLPADVREQISEGTLQRGD